MGKNEAENSNSNKKLSNAFPHEILDLYAVIPESDKTLSYVKLQFAPKTFRRALVDTGACANVISQTNFNDLKTDKFLYQEIVTQKSKLKRVRMAGGQLVPIEIEATICFKIAAKTFTEIFLVLPTANSMILGNCFYKKHDVQICPKYDLLKFPDVTIQINEIKTPSSKRHKKQALRVPVILSKKYVIPPQKTVLLECFTEIDIKNTIGTVVPVPEFEDESNIALMSSISETTDDSKLYISALNVTDHVITLPNKSTIANFSILTSTDMKNIIPIDPQTLALAKMTNPENVKHEINQLIQVNKSNDVKPIKPKPEYEKFWFPTPETCENPNILTPIQREIYDQILHFKNLELCEPKSSDHDRLTFLDQFNWENSVLTNEQRSQVEHLLVKYSDIFAKHRFDVGYNSELQIKLTPEHQRPLYTQGPPTPIHLRKELTIELALMHYFGLITTLSQSKYSSPLFAHRKPSGKLRMLIDLRRINHSLKNDYLNANFPISNMTDASNHFAGKKLFTKLDCSQAYHCVQMADDISVQLLAFNFSSRTYAYKCLAQGLNKSVTGFSSFIRHYLDPCLAGDMCTQFMDDIGSAVHTFDELIPNLSKIFECIRKSGLKLSPSKCEIGTQKMKFLGNIVTPAGVSPEETKIQKFLRNIRMPQTAKQVKRLIGFVQFFRNYMPSLGDKLLPFYKLLKQDVEFRILDEHRKGLEVLKHDLLQATTITLRLPKPDLQYVILCDASCHGTGFVLMVEDYVNTENKGKTKTYAPVSFGSRLFNEPQLKFSIYYKEFLALYFALDHFAHFIWGASKPVIVLTDNRSLTSFFQSKSIPPSVWNFLDRVLAFNIVIAHIPGKANYAADFLSRMQTDPNASLSLRLTDKIPVREIHIDSTAKLPDASLNSIEIKEAFSDQVVMTNEIRQQLESLGLLETYMLKQNKIENSDELEAQAFVRLVGPTISAIDYPDPADLFSDLSDRSEPLDLKLEQEKDPDIQEVKNWITENKIPDLKYASSRRKKYAKQINRLELKDAILYRKFFNDTGQVKYLQYCLPKHLWQEVVYRLHNSPSGEHIGMGRTLEEFRKRFYFPGFTEFFVNIIRNCLTCLQLKKSSSRYQTPPLQPISSLQSFPGEMMQIDIVGPFQSPVYKFVLTGIDVFSKYLFAMPLTNVSADTVARELTKIFFTHSYVPKRILADLGTTFTSKLMHELASLLEIQVSHATLKHPQTIGLVEKSHGALKRILKLNTNEQWSDWHKYVPLATFIHNTSYYSSIGCSPSAIFHGRDPIKPLDLRFSTKALEAISVESDFVTALQDAMLEKFKETKQNIIDAYQRYRGYYDQKALAQPLNLHAFCLLLNPKLTTQSEFGSHSKQVWIPLYRVEKVLTNSNYLIRKVGTIYTQCVHRIRLKPIVPQQAPDDLDNLDPTTFMTDPSLGKYRGEPELFDECIPQLLEDFHNPTTEEPSQIQGPSSVQLSVPLGAAPGPVVPPPPPPPPPVVPAPHPVVAPAIPIVAPPPADEANEQIDNEDPHRDIQFPDPDAQPNNDDTFNLDLLFQEQEPIQTENQRPQRQAAFEARDRIHAQQVQFNKRVQQREITPPPLIVRRYGMRTLGGHEKAPTTFTSRHNAAARKKSIQEQAAIANENLSLNREEKGNVIKNSVKRAKQSLLGHRRSENRNDQTEDGQGPSTLNSIETPTNIVIGSGDILRFPGPIAHCVSSDFAMGKGLAKQIAAAYPEIKSSLLSIENPQIGSSIAYFEPTNKKFIYNLITKNLYFEKPMYYHMSVSLCQLRAQLNRHGIKEIALPKLGCGLDGLSFEIVYQMIADVFYNTDIKVYLYM